MARDIFTTASFLAWVPGISGVMGMDGAAIALAAAAVDGISVVIAAAV
jgi:hypothetical protein